MFSLERKKYLIGLSNECLLYISGVKFLEKIRLTRKNV